VPFSREEIDVALNYSVAANDSIRKILVNADEKLALPADAFLVSQFIEKQNGVESEEVRALMLLALARTAKLAQGEKAACVFQGAAYTMNGPELVKLDTNLRPNRVGAIAQYPVTYAKSKGDGMIYPEGYQLGVFWAYLKNEEVRPLFLSDMKAAWDYLDQKEPMLTKDGRETALAVCDDNNDRWPEANTREEIGLVGWALKRTLTRIKEPSLVYIKGVDAYRVSVKDGSPIREAPKDAPYLTLKDGKDQTHFETPFVAQVEPCLSEIESWLRMGQSRFDLRLSWTTSHGVEPATQALGAQGCGECHSKDSYFFSGPVTWDPFDEHGKPRSTPMYRMLGYEADGIRLGAWREQVLKPWSPWIVLAALMAMLVHFVLFGLHQRTGGYGEPDGLRFRFHERVAHAAAMVAVTFLAVTGFFFLLGRSDPLGPWARQWHTWIGFVGAAGTVLIFLFWFFRMFPARGDLKWMLHAGGYLGGKGHYPAGKFNAGQKVLFWLAIALMVVLSVTGILMCMVDVKGAPPLSMLRQRPGWSPDFWSPNQPPAVPLLYTIHDVAALAMILVLVAHVYLAMDLNPHSLRSLFGGRVSLAWAQEHHPNWKPAE
jgi:formate dehydrogenase gamma subunit